MNRPSEPSGAPAKRQSRPPFTAGQLSDIAGVVSWSTDRLMILKLDAGETRHMNRFEKALFAAVKVELKARYARAGV